jgi:hypothetical protein
MAIDLAHTVLRVGEQIHGLRFLRIQLRLYALCIILQSSWNIDWADPLGALYPHPSGWGRSKLLFFAPRFCSFRDASVLFICQICRNDAR